MKSSVTLPFDSNYGVSYIGSRLIRYLFPSGMITEIFWYICPILSQVCISVRTDVTWIMGWRGAKWGLPSFNIRGLAAEKRRLNYEPL